MSATTTETPGDEKPKVTPEQQHDSNSSSSSPASAMIPGGPTTRECSGRVSVFQFLF
ncbi:unnamed protein product [Gongylonema pulchrum]|uniref:Uncharacterized protein n=1 Tax=Gongylonema pulchrum TaxID=637853 RepID=A0A183DEY9_9BILA|nr:unnamed protein product [Gongylonema pulchrum]